MKRDGLTLKGEAGEQTIKVHVLFFDELSQMKEKIEVLFVTVKSNDTAKVLAALKPYLAKNAWVISPQNGINEDVIVPIVGRANTIGCISYTGGGLLKPGYVIEHLGGLVIGELDGQITPRIKELAQILGLVRKTEISANIMLERWNKLSQVAMSVPTAVISGLSMGHVFVNERTQRLFGCIMSEVAEVAAAAGYKMESVIGVGINQWKGLAKGPMPEVSEVIAQEGAKFPPSGSDPMTNDIKRGRPLEIDFTNGYIVKKGKEVGVPTPVNDLLLSTIREIEGGRRKPSLDNVDEILSLVAC
jgi:2-dehydropantoate 2-reductase